MSYSLYPSDMRHCIPQTWDPARISFMYYSWVYMNNIHNIPPPQKKKNPHVYHACPIVSLGHELFMSLMNYSWVSCIIHESHVLFMSLMSEGYNRTWIIYVRVFCWGGGTLCSHSEILFMWVIFIVSLRHETRTRVTQVIIASCASPKETYIHTQRMCLTSEWLRNIFVVSLRRETLPHAHVWHKSL